MHRLGRAKIKKPPSRWLFYWLVANNGYILIRQRPTPQSANTNSCTTKQINRPMAISRSSCC